MKHQYPIPNIGKRVRTKCIYSHNKNRKKKKVKLFDPIHPEPNLVEKTNRLFTHEFTM